MDLARRAWIVRGRCAGRLELLGLRQLARAIHEGNGEALILIDARANDRQRDAIGTLVGGTVGGPWGLLAWTWPKAHGPVHVPYNMQLNGIGSRMKAGNVVEFESTLIKNPVN